MEFPTKERLIFGSTVTPKEATLYLFAPLGANTLAGGARAYYPPQTDFGYSIGLATTPRSG